jgi:hypothetical protein
MNPRYRATARRHRVLFGLIILLCAFLGLSQALGAPKLYRSSATISFPSFDSANSQFVTPPAQQGQETLTELMATRNFPETVAARSPLGAYLKHHTTTGSGPITMLKQLLKGSPTYDERVATAFGPKRLTSTAAGSNILDVSLEAPTPSMAQKTLGVLIDHFLEERKRLQTTAVEAATTQLTKAHKQLSQAQADLNAYARSHPGSTTNGDIELQALNNAQLQATRQLKAATIVANNALGQVSQDLPSTAIVFDTPDLPVGPTTGKKRVGELTIVGAFVGALISFGLIALMSRGKREEALSVRPVELREASSNGNGGTPDHEPEHEHEVLTGEAGSGEQIRRE